MGLALVICNIILYALFVAYLEKEAPKRYEELGGASLYIWPPSQLKCFLYMTRFRFLADMKTKLAKGIGLAELTIIWTFIFAFAFGGLIRAPYET